MPEPDLDQVALMQALISAGVDAQLVAWTDPTFDWSTTPLAVIRSTWDYAQRQEAFLAWLDRAASVTRLLNPAEIIRANSHKSYLLELSARGIPSTPTELVRKGEATPLVEILAGRGWRDVVIKPAVSAGSWDTFRAAPEDGDKGEAWLRRLTIDRDALVQPYLQSVEDHGERALVWIDGELTHSVRKTPRWHDGDEAVSEAMPVSEAEAALATAALAPYADELLYARVDVAPGPAGRLVIMELELIEPSLFLLQHPAALARLVAGIQARL